MTSVPNGPEQKTFDLTPLLDTLDDDGRGALLGCYRLLLAIAEREGIDVSPLAQPTAEGER